MNRVVLVLMIGWAIFEVYMWRGQQNFNRAMQLNHALEIHRSMQNQNSIKFGNSKFRVYGFEGARTVRKAYAVYYPVYMAESSYELLREEVQNTGK